MHLSVLAFFFGTSNNITNTTTVNASNSTSGIHLILIFVITLLVAGIVFYYFKFYRVKDVEDKGLSSGFTSDKGKFKIVFKISDENGKPINDAFLLLQKESGEIEFSNKIPSTVTIPNLEEGKYNIKIVKDNYTAINQIINLKSDITFDGVLKKEKEKRLEGLIKGVAEGMFIVEIFVQTPAGIPVSNAKILIGNQKNRQEVRTNSEGTAIFTIPKGEYFLSIEKELCETQIKHITVNNNEKFVINVIPAVKITPEQRNRLQNAYSMVLGAYNEIHSSYEKTIPKYFVKVAERVVKEIEKQAENVNFNSKEEYENAMNKYISAAETSMKILSAGMLENRNILLYAKLSQTSKEIDPPELPPIEKISISDAYKILSEIDNVLIYEIRNIWVYPVAVLWKVAKTLLNEPGDASAHIGGIFLKAAEFMLKNEELRKRLTIQVL